MRKVHLSLHVRGAIGWRNPQLDGLLIHSDGRRMSAAETRAALLEVLSQGIERLPIGDCDNFDPKTGCRGHTEPSPKDETGTVPESSLTSRNDESPRERAPEGAR